MPVRTLGKALGLDRTASYRRAKRAGDYLKNLEEKKGKPMRLKLGDEALPEDQEIFPTVEALKACCTVARQTEGYAHPPSPSGEAKNEKAETVQVLV